MPARRQRRGRGDALAAPEEALGSDRSPLGGMLRPTLERRACLLLWPARGQPEGTACRRAKAAASAPAQGQERGRRRHTLRA